ncbi:MAG: RIP metalloprotease RseP, partial [Enterococcus lemanii]
AGIQAGDEILSINEVDVSDWAQVRTQIQQHPKEDLQIELSRDGQKITVMATSTSVTVEGKDYGQLGIEAPMKTGFAAKVVGALQESVNSFTQILTALKGIVFNFQIDQLGGPVAIYQMSSQAASQGAMTVIYLMAMISMNLGIFNLLPIPGLDGGKLLLNLIEGVRGKPLSQEKEGLISIIGFGLLMLLMILVTWNDIQRFFF